MLKPALLMKALSHLMGLSSLKHMDLTDTKVTAEGVAMLKKAIPGIKIEWDGKETQKRE